MTTVLRQGPHGDWLKEVTWKENVLSQILTWFHFFLRSPDATHK